MPWRAPQDGRRGRPAVVSNPAIQVCLSIKLLFKLPLRQTAGMVASLLRLAGLDGDVADCATLCRRPKTLAVQIRCRRADGRLNLPVDIEPASATGSSEPATATALCCRSCRSCRSCRTRSPKANRSAR